MRWDLTFIALAIIGCGSPLDGEMPPADTAFSTATILPEATETKHHWFKIVILDVGQGDATMLFAPNGETLLIDTGPPGRGPKAVREVLKEMERETVETVFISHHHEDHMGGLEALKKEEAFLATDIIDKTNAEVGSRFGFGDLAVAVLAANGQIGNRPPPPGAAEDENNLSLALLVEYGAFRYFTDGDLPGGGGIAPYQTPDLETPLAPLAGDIDILLVPHHGSHTSTNPIFLDTLKPEIAVLSLGDDNDHFHPHYSVLQRLKKSGAKIWATEQGAIRNGEEHVKVVGGHICITTNGQTYQIKPYAVDKCADPP